MDNGTYTGNASNAPFWCIQMDASKILYCIIFLILQTLLTWYLCVKYFCKEKKQLITTLNESYTSFESRFQSFENSNIELSPYVCNLCEAGFYYIGDRGTDGVACFSCNIRLHSWENHDNPWVQHARWSKDCSYLLLCKGQLFVERVHGIYDIGGVHNDQQFMARHVNWVAGIDNMFMEGGHEIANDEIDAGNVLQDHHHHHQD